jgi:hypothetical protein
MKALSLTQPWATLVAIGAKKIETRSWGTTPCGTIAIHAAKKMTRADVDICLEYPFVDALSALGVVFTAQDLPRGAILAIADFVGCIGTDQLYESERGRAMLTSKEEAFGNYESGRFAFVFRRVRRLREPIPCNGALGLWTVPPDIEERLNGLL